MKEPIWRLRVIQISHPCTQKSFGPPGSGKSVPHAFSNCGDSISPIYNTAYKKVESSTKMLVQMTTGIRQFLNARFIYISFVTWFMTSWAQWTTNHNAARNSNLTHVIHDVTRMRKTLPPQKKWRTPQKKVEEKWSPPLKRRSKRPYLTTNVTLY